MSQEKLGTYLSVKKVATKSDDSLDYNTFDSYANVYCLMFQGGAGTAGCALQHVYPESAFEDNPKCHSIGFIQSFFSGYLKHLD